MVEESDKSDSWGNLLIDEILSKINQVSVKRSENRNGNQEHLLIGSTRPKIAKEVSKNMVTKKVVKGLYPKRYKSENKFTSNPPTISAWCKERQIKGYGPKIMNSQNRITDSIEKQTNLNIKEDNSLKSSEQITVQTGKTSSIHPINFIEDNKDLGEVSTTSVKSSESLVSSWNHKQDHKNYQQHYWDKHSRNPPSIT